jgi:putative addiction module component (TIGR02574 family)
MSAPLSAHEIIASALRLPLEAREEIIVALEASLDEDAIDHGPEEPANEVETAWADEIARRVADIDAGRVKTIPADEAERMIRGEFKPRI